MIRIAIIAGALHSGGKRNLIMEYYRQIDRTKVQFDFICDSISNGIPKEEIEKMGGQVYIVPPYNQIVPHIKETYKILKENKYTVMHAWDNTLNVFPMAIGKAVGVKIRISESISKGDKNEKKTFIKYILRIFSHCYATHFMANSIDCGKWQFGKTAYEKGMVNIFKSVINTEENAFDRELREKTREDFGWSNQVVYGFIGRYVPQKNPLFLVDIFSEIAKRQENAKLVMIGFGGMEEAIIDRVKKYGIEDKVENLGHRDDIKQFYNAFDAFLLPSLYEGMPVVGIEAQCAGLPIFFSKNVTEETTACELAHYIGLDETASQWAEKIIPVVEKNIPQRRSHTKEVAAAGFDSKSEAERLHEFYLKIIQTSDRT